jgi:hypothetical protein
MSGLDAGGMRVASLRGAPGPLATAALAALATGALAAPTGALAAPAGRETVVSENWAGYVARPRAGGVRFSSVSGTWTQPTASCSAGRESFSAVWVGLGGYGQSRSLEQLGTNTECTRSGRANYTAWLELLPAAPSALSMKVRPGDRISASVTTSASHVTLRLRNLTTGARYGTTRHYSRPDNSSAEWIVEAPSTCASTGSCATLPLSDFGTVSFVSATATAHGRTGTVEDPAWSAAPVELVQPAAGRLGAGRAFAGQAKRAVPSAVSSADGSFSVSFSEAPSSLSAARPG